MSPVDPDGVTRVVLSHVDPGVRQLIDTQGHQRGWLLLRNMSTTPRTGTAHPAGRRVEPSEKSARLPLASRPLNGVAELRRRRAANLRRYPI